jgi:hypothetical protein
VAVRDGCCCFTAAVVCDGPCDAGVRMVLQATVYSDEKDFAIKPPQVRRSVSMWRQLLVVMVVGCAAVATVATAATTYYCCARSPL